MDFDLSADQAALRDAARALLDDRCDTTAIRRACDDGGFDAGLWAAMVDQGWSGIAVPERLGGVGLGTVEAAVLLEQTGAHLAPVPLLQQMMALAVLADGPWGERLLSGEAIACVARTPLARAADGTVSGRLEPVIYGARADVLVAPAGSDRGGVAESRANGSSLDTERTEDGRDRGAAAESRGEAAAAADAPRVPAGLVAEELVVVDLAEVVRSPEPAMDLTRELAWIDLDGAAAVTVGGAEEAAAHLDRGAVFHSAEMLGAAETVMGMAVEYAKVREQFGRPIGSFQAVKHRCADMLVDVEGMRSAAYHAAWALGAGGSEAAEAAAVAKIWCSDAGLRVAESALQVHGGIGFTWEADVHLYLKRAQLDSLSFGDARHHRARLASLLRDRVESGAGIWPDQ